MPQTFFSRAPLARAACRMFAVAAVVALAACGSDVTGPNQRSDPRNENFASALGVDISSMTERQPRLFIQDRVVGTGAEVVPGSRLRVRYTGWLRTGVEFDSNVASGSPFELVIGASNLISGWSIGLPGMRVGGKRLLVLGSEHAYGASGSGSIPPHATLVFEVELISIVN